MSLKGIIFFCLFFLCFAEADALDKRSSKALSHYIMGVVYEDLGDIDTAIEQYKDSLKQDNTTLVHLSLASTFIKKNDYPKAIEELNQAISLDPQAIEPHALLAILYSAKGEPDLAAGEYEAALKGASKLQPQNIDIYKSLGSIYLQQKKFKEALDTYKLILELSEDDAEAHFYLGGIYYELKSFEAAERELKAAIELKPDYHEALNFLGYFYVERDKNLEQAEAMIRKALVMQPENGAYIDSLGWFYFKKGNFKEALTHLKRAAGLLEDAVIYEHLGDVFFKLSDKENAIFNWQKSLKLQPEQENVKEKLGGLKSVQ